MNIGYKLYEGTENFEELQLEMALTCDANGWCMEDGYDEEGRRYLVINPPCVPTLDEIKAQKIASLKAQRDTLEVMPIEYNGKPFDYDDKARDRINAAIIALDLQGENAYLSWTCADQSEAIMTANDLRMVIAAVAVRSNALHVAYRVAKDAVMAADTVEAVETVELEV